MDSIQASVGRGGRNRFEDVATVQTLLNDSVYLLIPLAPLEPDGTVGQMTIGAIEEFQRRVMRLRRPDGRVDPAGRTMQTLTSRAREVNEALVLKLLVPMQLRFPLLVPPAKSYKTGMRRFGVRRKRGRLHAGCDLYASVGTAIYAMDEGEVIRDVYAFYLGTYALEVQHPNFIARYGEIASVSAGLKKGSKISRGQQIARVGELRGLNMSMLHLEMYTGKGSGSLTVRANKPYQRRSDLIDPTRVLDSATVI